MRTNGYKIIDFGEIDISTGFTETIEGTFDKIDKSNKPIVITGIKDMKPAYVAFSKISTGATTFAYIGMIGVNTDGIIMATIGDDDSVDITIGS